jgi:hypothetical protein
VHVVVVAVDKQVRFVELVDGGDALDGPWEEKRELADLGRRVSMVTFSLNS